MRLVVLIVVILFAIGSLIMVSQVVLCSGTFWQNKTTLYVFLVLMWIILIIQVAFTIWLYDDLPKFSSQVRAQLTTLMKRYGENGDMTMNEIQYDYSCCGVEGYKDWYNTTWGYLHPYQIPGSCCNSFSPTCVANMTVSDMGCDHVVSDEMFATYSLLITVTLFASFYQVVGISLAYVLTRVIH